MAFPISYKRRKPILPTDDYGAFSDAFFNIIKARITATEFMTFRKDGNHAFFRGPVFRFAWNGYNFLNGITKGEVQLEKDEKNYIIRHKIYFTEFFVIALLFSLLPVALLFNPFMSFMAALIIWLVFYAGSCILSIIRFNRFIKKTVIKIHPKKAIAFYATESNGKRRKE